MSEVTLTCKEYTRSDKGSPSWGSCPVEAHLESCPALNFFHGARTGFGILGLLTYIYDQFWFSLSELQLYNTTCDTSPSFQCQVDLSGPSFELLTNAWIIHRILAWVGSRTWKRPSALPCRQGQPSSLPPEEHRYRRDWYTCSLGFD